MQSSATTANHLNYVKWPMEWDIHSRPTLAKCSILTHSNPYSTDLPFVELGMTATTPLAGDGKGDRGNKQSEFKNGDIFQQLTNKDPVPDKFLGPNLELQNNNPNARFSITEPYRYYHRTQPTSDRVVIGKGLSKVRPKERPFSCHIDPTDLAELKSNYPPSMDHNGEFLRSFQRAAAASDKISQYVLDKNSQTLYIKGKLLGRGGFAKCHKFTDLTNNAEFAAKIISKSQLTKTSHKEQVTREIEIHKTLSHVNVVHFHRYFEDDINMYIILEYCDNKTLVDLLKLRGTLTEGETRYFMKQILCAVSYIHALKILHRDLKLGNMFLTKHYHLKVGDFGLSSHIQENCKKVSICGTPNYIAPEILQKTGHGFPADIWAIGCIMYAMLVGKPPFESGSLRETYHRISKNIYKMPDNISPGSKDLVSKLLIAQPQLRIELETAIAHHFFNERSSNNIPNMDISPTGLFGRDVNRHHLPGLGTCAPLVHTHILKDPKGDGKENRNSKQYLRDSVPKVAENDNLVKKKKRYSGLIFNTNHLNGACNEIKKNPHQNSEWDEPDVDYNTRVQRYDNLTRNYLESNVVNNPNYRRQMATEISAMMVKAPKTRRYSMANAYASGKHDNEPNSDLPYTAGNYKMRDQRTRPTSMIYPLNNRNKTGHDYVEACLRSDSKTNKTSVNTMIKFFKPLDPKKLKTTFAHWVSQVKRQKTKKESKEKSIIMDRASDRPLMGDTDLVQSQNMRPRSRSTLMSKPKGGVRDHPKQSLDVKLANAKPSITTKRYSCSTFDDKYDSCYKICNKDIDCAQNKMAHTRSYVRKTFDDPENFSTNGPKFEIYAAFENDVAQFKTEDQHSIPNDGGKDPRSGKSPVTREPVTLATQETDFLSSSSSYPSSCLDKSESRGTPNKENQGEESHSSGIVCPSPSSHGSYQRDAILDRDTSLSKMNGELKKCFKCDGIIKVTDNASFNDGDVDRPNFAKLEKTVKKLISRTQMVFKNLNREDQECQKNNPDVAELNNYCELMGIGDLFDKGFEQNDSSLHKNRAGFVWVTKWIDYTEKYGFGYQLSDGTRGVIFNDGSRIQKTLVDRVTLYDVNNYMAYDAYLKQNYPKSPRYNLPDCLNRGEGVSFTVLERISILSYFSDFMEKNLIESGDENYKPKDGENCEHETTCVCDTESCYYVRHKWFVRSEWDNSVGDNYALVMYLNRGVVQINFLRDHTKLILGSRSCGGGCSNKDRSTTNWMIFIDSDRKVYTFPDAGKEILKTPTLLRAEGVSGHQNCKKGETVRIRISTLGDLEEKFQFALIKIQDLIKLNQYENKRVTNPR